MQSEEEQYKKEANRVKTIQKKERRESNKEKKQRQK